MTSGRHIRVTSLALLVLGAFALPAAAAGPGGAAPDRIALPGEQEIVVRVGNPLLRASAGELAIAARASAMVRGRVRIAGTAGSGTRAIRIERADARRRWVPVAHARVAANGRFRALWRPGRAGAVHLRARALARGGSAAGDPGTRGRAPQLELTVYRPGVASWYGPTHGAWQTYCGVPLLPATLGVAHETLPCGTPVALYYRGRTVVVPVIDRGPFVAGRTWDLTRAAHTALGATDGLITVGALPLRPAAAAASPFALPR